MSIGNHAYTLIDFDFVELLRSASSVLRLPRPHGERRTESRFIGTSSTQSKSIYSPSPSRSRFGGARLGLG